LKIIDISNPQRVNRNPDKTTVLLLGDFVEQGYTIKKIELRQFIEKSDQKLGPYSLVTTLIQTDKGDIESLYDEGYRGKNVLDSTANFILNNLGLSGIILRSLISLNQELKKQKT
jgi:hypothetical protein